MTNNQLAENSVIQLLNSVKLARDNAERADNRVDHSFYYALTIALEELQERRKAERDSEPVAIIDQANLDYLRSGADADVWPPEREEMGDVLLYRHAQPAPEKYNIGDATMRHIFTPTGMTNVSDMQAVFDRVEAVLVGMEQPAPVMPDKMTAIVKDEAEFVEGWNACRAAMLQAGTLINEGTTQTGNSLAIPDGWTGNDKANAALMMLDRIETADPVDDDRIDGIKRIVRELVAATQPQNAPQNIPEIIPLWIPVSERMPPSRHEVLVGRWWGEKPRWCCKWATYIPGHPDAQSSGWLIPGASWTPTHWMPLPAAPQEVKSES